MLARSRPWQPTWFTRSSTLISTFPPTRSWSLSFSEFWPTTGCNTASRRQHLSGDEFHWAHSPLPWLVSLLFKSGEVGLANFTRSRHALLCATIDRWLESPLP